MARSREELWTEARGLTTSKLVEKQQTSKSNCESWRREVQRLDDELPFYAVFGPNAEEQAEIDSAQKNADDWCALFDVYSGELTNRRATAPQATAAAETPVLERRATQRETRREEVKEETEEALVKQRDRSLIGRIASIPQAIIEAPFKALGLGADQTAEERAVGLVRLALVVGVGAAAYYFVARPLVVGAAGVAERGAQRTFALTEKVIESPIPGSML